MQGKAGHHYPNFRRENWAPSRDTGRHLGAQALNRGSIQDKGGDPQQFHWSKAWTPSGQGDRIALTTHDPATLLARLGCGWLRGGQTARRLVDFEST